VNALRCARFWLLGAIALGCAHPTPSALPADAAVRRGFDLERDVFDHPNQLYWEYEFDEKSGEQVGRPRDEPVEFGQRCMTMARGVRQFHRAARFEPDLPRVSEAEYRALVRRVFATGLREEDPDERIAIPGYADLRSFSREHEQLVKSETPGGWRSYVQRGNWRMFFAFFDFQQRATARELLLEIDREELPIVRVVRFPKITVNHALLLYAAEKTATQIRFFAYDPNHLEGPLELVFDRGSASFVLPRRNYFQGGYVKVYEAYHGWLF